MKEKTTIQADQIFLVLLVLAVLTSPLVDKYSLSLILFKRAIFFGNTWTLAIHQDWVIEHPHHIHIILIKNTYIYVLPIQLLKWLSQSTVAPSLIIFRVELWIATIGVLHCRPYQGGRAQVIIYDMMLDSCFWYNQYKLWSRGCMYAQESVGKAAKIQETAFLTNALLWEG